MSIIIETITEPNIFVTRYFSTLTHVNKMSHIPWEQSEFYNLYRAHPWTLKDGTEQVLLRLTELVLSIYLLDK